MKMEERKSRKTPRLQGFDYSTNGMYFITICTQNRRNLLSRIVGTGVLDCPKIELTQYGEVVQKYLNKLNDFYADYANESDTLEAIKPYAENALECINDMINVMKDYLKTQ